MASGKVLTFFINNTTTVMTSDMLANNIARVISASMARRKTSKYLDEVMYLLKNHLNDTSKTIFIAAFISMLHVSKIPLDFDDCFLGRTLTNFDVALVTVKLGLKVDKLTDSMRRKIESYFVEEHFIESIGVD